MRAGGLHKEYRGYDPGRVDAFLARCLATPGVSRSRFPELRHLRPAGPPVTREEVDAVRFGQATWGYSIRRVDAVLDRIAETVGAKARVPRVLTPSAPWQLVDAVRLPVRAVPARAAAERPFVAGPDRPRT